MKYILIIAGGLQVGGAEKVAANICLYSDNKEFEFHYIVFEGLDNAYGPDIEKHGGKVFTVSSPSANIKKYLEILEKLNNKYHYTAIHSHTMFNSGVNLKAAKKMKINCRIVHSHTTKTETHVSIKHRLYEFVMRKMINKYATDMFACGVEAGNWLFGKRNFSKNGVVIKNGIDVDAYSFSEINRNNIRDKLCINKNFVIAHSGTILPLKNQKFLVNIMPLILKRKPEAKLMLMGDGDAENLSSLKKEIANVGIEKHVILCGCLNNVNEYLSAADVFAFPSTREGTPLALIEAQANGLPCIISDVIPNDAIITDLVQKVPLSDADKWVDAICNSERKHNVDYSVTIAKNGYDLRTSMEKIYETYRKEN